MNDHYFPIIRGLWQDYLSDVDTLLQRAIDTQAAVWFRLHLIFFAAILSSSSCYPLHYLACCPSVLQAALELSAVFQELAEAKGFSVRPPERPTETEQRAARRTLVFLNDVRLSSFVVGLFVVIVIRLSCRHANIGTG